MPIPVKVEFDEYYLPARAPGRLALLGWRASLQWQAGLKNKSFVFDFKILWMTFVKVVRREGVTH